MDSIRARRVRLPLLALVGGEGISWAGNALARVAVPWFVLEAGGSASQPGVVVGVEMLPSCWTPRASRHARRCCPMSPPVPA